MQTQLVRLPKEITMSLVHVVAMGASDFIMSVLTNAGCPLPIKLPQQHLQPATAMGEQ
jgi:hypothetical protein